MNWEQRANLAERMWPVAASFACLVHEGDAQGVEAFLKASTRPRRTPLLSSWPR